MRRQDLSRELDIACALARRAGSRILEHYATDFAVQYKGAADDDPVTQADKDANAIIVSGLREHFPDDAILAEESPPTHERMARRRLWCVDPLDGTREFIARNGQFVVMIGLALDGEACMGVVYQPTEDALYWGAGDQAGAELRGVSHTLNPARCSDPAAAIMVVSRSHRSRSVGRVADALGIREQLPLGSVGLKASRVADGSAHLYLSVSNRTHEWDACAPEAIVRGAGGLMTDVRGQPLRYNKPEPHTPFGLLASNGALHAACVQALEPIVAERGW